MASVPGGRTALAPVKGPGREFPCGFPVLRLCWCGDLAQKALATSPELEGGSTTDASVARVASMSHWGRQPRAWAL